MIVNDVCVQRPDSNYALFKMSYHGKSKRNPVRENLLFSTTKRMRKDGLSDYYRLNINSSEEKKYPFFTVLKVNVGSMPKNYINKYNFTIIRKID